MRLTWRVLGLAVLLHITLLSSCNGGSQGLTMQPGGSDTPATGEADSPQLLSLDFDFLNPPKSATADPSPSQADGSDFEQALPHSNVFSSSPLASYSGNFSYAIYSMEHTVVNDWLGVFLEYDEMSSNREIWVGLSDYENLRWEWRKTDNWYNVALFPKSDKFKSQTGTTYVAIVGWDSEVALRSIRLDYSYGIGGNDQGRPWNTVIGTIRGRGHWSYDTTIPAYSNAGKPDAGNYDDPETPGHYISGQMWQCPEFCDRFIWRIWNYDSPSMTSIYAGGRQGAGNGAWKWFYQDLQTNDYVNMTRHYNGTSTEPPKPGDVLVWAAQSPSNPGHVAVVKEVNLSENFVACIQQNVYDGLYDGHFLLGLQKTGSTYTITSEGYLRNYTILGWIRYGNFIPAGAAPVPTPTGFNATSLLGKILLIWDAFKGSSSADGNIDNYILARNGVPIQYPPGDASSYEDTVAGPGPYTYTLVAQDSGQSSSPAFTTGSPQPPPLDPPTGVACTKGSIANVIGISWNPVAGATTYNIYADGNSSPKFWDITGTTYTDTLASNGYGHYYRIRAANGTNLSNESLLNWGWAGKTPLSTLTSTETSGSAPLDIQFDASGSHDLDGLSGTGPITDFEWDFDGDGIFNETSATPPESSKRGQSAPLVTYTIDGVYSVRVRVTDDDGVKKESNYRTITVDTESSPIAVIAADPTSGEAPLSVSFDASESTDPDGGDISLYEWDWENDGTYDESGNSSTTSHQYSTTGTYTCTVRVTDDEGDSDSTESEEISVTPSNSEWHHYVVDTNAGTNLWSSVAEINGKPAISYHVWPAEKDLRYAINSSTDGSGNWNVITVASEGYVGNYTSLALVDNKPAISYSKEGSLMYAYSSTADGSSGWSSLMVDTSGVYTSLEVVNGKPAVSYYYLGSRDIKYAYSSMVDGSSDWTTLTIDDSAVSGNGDTSLAIIGGKPAIAYWDATNCDIRYAYCSLVDGSSGWTYLTVSELIDAPFHPCVSLASIAGKPAISFIDPATDGIKYAHSSVADGSSNWSVVDVGGIGNYTGLTESAGYPRIAYMDNSDYDLKYATNSYNDGSGDWSSITVDEAGNVGQSLSVAIINGHPAIAYGDASNGDLKFAIYH